MKELKVIRKLARLVLEERIDIRRNFSNSEGQEQKAADDEIVNNYEISINFDNRAAGGLTGESEESDGAIK